MKLESKKTENMSVVAGASKYAQKGITLIALVITIIVLLILAGVVINLALGENGILKMAEKAGKNYISAQEKELADLNSFENEMQDSMNGGHTNSESNDASEEPENLIDETTSYVGYYADFEGDGIVDGVIYADLAVGESGTWNDDSWSNYSYSAQTGLKDYNISKTDYEGIFGTKDVLSPTGSGNDRFYVMALADFTTTDNNYFCWYAAAFGNLDGAVATDYKDFGAGKTNTVNMINAWNNPTYGTQNDGSYPDMWGVIQSPTKNSIYGKNSKYDIVTSTSDSGKWFVPSKAEWSAFGDYLYTKVGITEDNYGNYGLSDNYWSSSQYNTYYAYTATFDDGYISSNRVDGDNYVRLSATF